MNIFNAGIKFFIVFFVLMSGVIASETTKKYKGIKVGFEVEITGPFKYKAAESEEGLRHKRLLNIKKADGKIVWYVEVDSSNKDIEIVSVPFAMPLEDAEFDTVIHSVGIFLNFLGALPLSTPDTISFDTNALESLNKIIRPHGFSAELAEVEFHIEKRHYPGLWIVPQITYQIPLETMHSFFHYFSEKEGFFEEAEKGLFRKFDGNPDEITGLYNLMSFYLENLRYRAHEKNKKLVEMIQTRINKPRFDSKLRDFISQAMGAGVSPFDHVKAIFESVESLDRLEDLQTSAIQFYKEVDNFSKKETGLKQSFPIMSRLSFSGMFSRVDGVAEKAAVLREKFTHNSYDPSMRVTLEYPIMENPLYNNPRNNLNQTDIVYPYRYVSTDIFKGLEERSPANMTLEAWLQSVINPAEENSTRPFNPSPDEESSLSITPHKDLTVNWFYGYLRSAFPLRSNRKDLMSPVPFSYEDDSMGALDIGGVDLNYGSSILEVRRYGSYFSNKNIKFYKGNYEKVIPELEKLIRIEKENVLNYLRLVNGFLFD